MKTKPKNAVTLISSPEIEAVFYPVTIKTKRAYNRAKFICKVNNWHGKSDTNIYSVKNEICKINKVIGIISTVCKYSL